MADDEMEEVDVVSTSNISETERELQKALAIPLGVGHWELNFDKAINILREDPSLLMKYSDTIFFLGMTEKKMTVEILDTFYGSINYKFETLHMGHLPETWRTRVKFEKHRNYFYVVVKTGRLDLIEYFLKKTDLHNPNFFCKKNSQKQNEVPYRRRLHDHVRLHDQLDTVLHLVCKSTYLSADRSRILTLLLQCIDKMEKKMHIPAEHSLKNVLHKPKMWQKSLPFQTGSFAMCSRTALTQAILAGQNDLAEILIEYGCLVDVEGDDNETALSAAVQMCNCPMIETLAKLGANANVECDPPLLLRCVLTSNLTGIKHLHTLCNDETKCKLNVDQTCKFHPNKWTNFKNCEESALSLALKMKQDETVNLLLDIGCDVNQTTKSKLFDTNGRLELISNANVYDFKGEVRADGHGSYTTDVNVLILAIACKCPKSILNRIVSLTSNVEIIKAGLVMAAHFCNLTAVQILAAHCTQNNISSWQNYVFDTSMLDVLFPNSGAPQGQWFKTNDSAMICAIEKKQEDILHVLIRANADVNFHKPSPRSSSPLMIAINFASFNCLRKLIRAGADVNLQSYSLAANRTTTPLNAVLIHILEAGSDDFQNNILLFWKQIFNKLLSVGADPFAQDETGSNALHWAASLSNCEFLEIILDHDNRDLTRQENESMAEYVERCQYSMSNKNGKTPLSIAFSMISPTIVEVLMRRPQNLAKGTVGKLIMNAYKNYPDTERILLYLSRYDLAARNARKHGQIDFNGIFANRTPLQLVAFTGWVDGAKFLLDNKADINLVTPEFPYSPCLYSVINQKQQMVDFFCKNCDDMHYVDTHIHRHVDDKRISPLMAAIIFGDVSSVQSLLQFVNRTMDDDEMGQDAAFIDEIYDFNNLGIVELDEKIQALRKIGDFPTMEEKKDDKLVPMTLLSMACLMKHYEIVQLLIKMNCDVNKHSNGRTPLFIAIFVRSYEIFRILLDSGRVDMSIRDHNDDTYLMQSLNQPLIGEIAQSHIDDNEFKMTEDLLEREDNNVNFYSQQDTDQRAYTALGLAFNYDLRSESTIRLVKKLLKAGAKDEYPFTSQNESEPNALAIHFACQYGTKQLVKALCKQYEDFPVLWQRYIFESKDDNDCLVLSHLARNKKYGAKIFKYLWKYANEHLYFDEHLDWEDDRDMDPESKKKATALRICKLFTVRYQEGLTFLTEAVEENNVDLIRSVCKHRRYVDLRRANDDGTSIFTIPRTHGRQTDSNIVMHAVSQANLSVLNSITQWVPTEIIVADNEHGQNALSIAIKEDKTDCAKHLIPFFVDHYSGDALGVQSKHCFTKIIREAIRAANLRVLKSLTKEAGMLQWDQYVYPTEHMIATTKRHNLVGSSTPLQLAVKQFRINDLAEWTDFANIVKWLLSQEHNDPNYLPSPQSELPIKTILSLPCHDQLDKNIQYDIVSELIKCKANLNVALSYDETDLLSNTKFRVNITPLMDAINTSDNADIIELLINSGSEVKSVRDKLGNTPLIAAVKMARKEIIDVLLELDDAEFDATDSHNFTAVQIACGAALHSAAPTAAFIAKSPLNEQIAIKLIKSEKCDLTLKFDYHDFKYGYLEIGGMGGFNFSTQELHYVRQKKCTLLHLAVKNNQINLIHALVKAGFDHDNEMISYEDYCNVDSPIHWAIRYNQTYALQQLIECGFKIDVSTPATSDFKPNLPLYSSIPTSMPPRNSYPFKNPFTYAIALRRWECARFLIANNCDVPMSKHVNLCNFAFENFKQNADPSCQLKLQIAQGLIKRGHDVNKRYKNQTALFVAVKQSNETMVKFLISNKANPNLYSERFPADDALFATNRDRRREQTMLPLHAAVHKAVTGDHDSVIEIAVACVRMLIQANANVNAPILQASRATAICCSQNSQVTSALLEAGANPNVVFRPWSVMFWHEHIGNWITYYDFPSHIRTLFSMLNKPKMIPLTFSILLKRKNRIYDNNQLNFLTLLPKTNVNLHLPGDMSALHYAAYHPHYFYVVNLLQAGAKVNVSASNQMMTPKPAETIEDCRQTYCVIARQGHHFTSDLYREDTHYKLSFKGCSPLQCAILVYNLAGDYHDHSFCIDALIKAGADVNFRPSPPSNMEGRPTMSNLGHTPLGLACFGGDVRSVERLLQAKCDTRMDSGERGQTALLIACESSFQPESKTSRYTERNQAFVEIALILIKKSCVLRNWRKLALGQWKKKIERMQDDELKQKWELWRQRKMRMRKYARSAQDTLTPDEFKQEWKLWFQRRDFMDEFNRVRDFDGMTVLKMAVRSNRIEIIDALLKAGCKSEDVLYENIPQKLVGRDYFKRYRNSLTRELMQLLQRHHNNSYVDSVDDMRNVDVTNIVKKMCELDMIDVHEVWRLNVEWLYVSDGPDQNKLVMKWMENRDVKLHGNNVLSMAIDFKSMRLLEYLTGKGVNVNKSCRIAEADIPNLQNLKDDIKVNQNDQSFELKYKFFVQKLCMTHPLIRVTCLNDDKDSVKVAKYLLDNGGDLECRDDLFSCTPFQWAVWHKCEGLINLYIERGCKTNLTFKANEKKIYDPDEPDHSPINYIVNCRRARSMNPDGTSNYSTIDPKLLRIAKTLLEKDFMDGVGDSVEYVYSTEMWQVFEDHNTQHEKNQQMKMTTFLMKDDTSMSPEISQITWDYVKRGYRVPTIFQAPPQPPGGDGGEDEDDEDEDEDA